jgi:hypothetical protein
VSLDAADFFLKDAMPETSFEFSLSQRRRRDAHGFLTAAQQDLYLIIMWNRQKMHQIKTP